MPFERSKSTGFTLAEVLISLTIIGVIAALTIPNLMHEYKMKELEALYKKGYNSLYDLNQRFRQDTGFDICEYARENNGGTAGTQAISAYMREHLGGTSAPAPAYYQYQNIYHIKNLINGNASNGAWDDAPSVNLNNQYYYFEYNATSTKYGGKCPLITVDFNGKKGPNRWGYDVFSFYPREENSILPCGTTNASAKSYRDLSKQETYCNYSSTTMDNGIGCAYWASVNKAPDGTDKTYWEWLRF